MFTWPTYHQQSIGLSTEIDFQVTLLKWTDASIKLREVGKIGTVTGAVSAVAGGVFGYNPIFALSITVISGLVWLCSHELAESLEPQAQSIIEQFKKVKEV